MNALDLVQRAQAGGWHLRPENGRLKLSGKGPMPAPLLNELRIHRDEVLALFSADDRDERAAVSEYEGGLPREWAEGLAILCTIPNPLNTPDETWRTIVNSAAKFADIWGQQAVDLGWSVRDVFGCNPLRPQDRVDQAGLVWLIGEGEVVAITADTAVLLMPTGSRLTYFRRGQAGEALIWRLGDQDHPQRRQ